MHRAGQSNSSAEHGTNASVHLPLDNRTPTTVRGGTILLECEL